MEYYATEQRVVTVKTRSKYKERYVQTTNWVAFYCLQTEAVFFKNKMKNAVTVNGEYYRNMIIELVFVVSIKECGFQFHFQTGLTCKKIV